jgi:hypothetical protein
MTIMEKTKLAYEKPELAVIDFETEDKLCTPAFTPSTGDIGDI